MIRHSVILDEPDRLREIVKYFLKQDAFAFDVETMGEDRGDPNINQVAWIGIGTHGGETYSIPMGHPHGSRVVGERKEPRADKNGKIRRFRVPVYEPAPPQMTPGTVFDILEPLFFNEDIIKIGHNEIFDLVSVAKYYDGNVPLPPYEDTIVEQWLINENLKQLGLKPLTKLVYGHDYDTENVGKCIEKHPFNKVAHYLFCDVKWTWLHRNRLKPKLELQDLASVLALETDLISPLIDMKRHGARVDSDELHRLKETLSEQLEVIEGKIYKAAGKRFNINAPRAKQDLLYLSKEEGGQGLKPWRLTKGGMAKKKEGKEITLRDYSTDAESLESYPTNPLASGLMEYAEVNKLLSTYIIAYIGDEEQGKKPLVVNEHLYADFVQYGTVTGRFSCRTPNLQNIPRPDTDLGKQIRGLFVAEKNSKLIVSDYDQCELVILAHYLGCGKLYDGFLEGIDPHTMTASGVLGKSPEDVTPAERQLFGKTLNFATNYSVGPTKVANMLKVSVKEAKEILATHQDTFPEIYAFKDHVIRECRKRKPPHIRTLLGRYRRVPEINYNDNSKRMGAERQVFNSLIQGGNADLIKLAMVRIHKTLPEDIHLILSVHDELVLSCPDDRVDVGTKLLQDAMVGTEMQDLLRVPLKAGIKVVDRWSNAK